MTITGDQWPGVAGSQYQVLPAPSTEPITVLDAGIVTGAGGGIEKTLVTGAPYHERTRYRSVVALLHPTRDRAFEVLRARALAAGTELYDREESFPFSPATVAWFAGLCRRHSVSIWHGHDYKTNAIGLLLQPLFGYSTVCTLHGWSERSIRTRAYFALDRHVIRHYDEVIAVSNDLYDSAETLGVASERLTLNLNGVDTDHYRRQTQLRTAFPLRIGAAGRLVPEKGFDILIYAVQALLDEGHDVELVIAGEGAGRQMLESQVARSRYASRLKLLGHVDDMHTFYEGLDIFCLSSLREGLPNVVLEAMAMSVPLVATAVGGIPHLLDDGRDALICIPSSSDSLRQALRTLIGDSELRTRLANEARKKAEKHSLAARMTKLFVVYDRLSHRST